MVILAILWNWSRLYIASLTFSTSKHTEYSRRRAIQRSTGLVSHVRRSAGQKEQMVERTNDYRREYEWFM